METLDTPEKIRHAINTFRADSSWNQLRYRWDKDFDIYRLKPYDAGRGYFSYTSNIGRLLADKIITLLTDSRLIVSVPDELLPEAERLKANNVERLLYGAFNLNDERMIATPDNPSLKEQTAWFTVIRGAAAWCIYTYKNEEGETEIDITPWDIYNTSYGVAGDKMLWAARTYKISYQEAKALYNATSATSQDVEITEYWDSEKYGTILNAQWAEGSPHTHDCGHCPVFIVRVGATPIVSQENYTFAPIHVGESVFSNNRDLLPVLNKVLSNYVTVVQRGVKTPLGIWSADGRTTIDEDIWQSEKAASVAFSSDVKVAPLLQPTMPADAAALLNLVLGDIQRGGLPHSAWGMVADRTSGYALNQINAAMMTIGVPFVQALEKMYRLACLEIISQYSKKNVPAIKVRGRTGKDAPFGYPFAETIERETIKGDWHPEIRVVPVLPKDDAQKAQLANMYRQGDIPLLSTDTIRGEILEIPDPDLEREKVDREWAESLIINRLWKAYVATLREGDRDAANNILAELRRLMGGQQRQGTGYGQNIIAQPGTKRGLEMAGTPGSGAEVPTNVPSSTLPPESLGGMPPGAMNARMPPMTEAEV